MEESMKYVSCFYGKVELSDLLDNYAYGIGIIDTDMERYSIPSTNQIKKIIDEMEKIYTNIKDIDSIVFIESLLLMPKNTQLYFFELISETSKRIEKNLRKIENMRDCGRIYDNPYTQELEKQYLLKKIFNFIRSTSDYSTLQRVKNPLNFIEENPKHNKHSILKEIWLPEAKISIKDIITFGIDNKLWNDNLNLITNRNTNFGSGKTLIASLSIALKGWSISRNSDYKVIGKAFCKAFNIEINNKTSNPYKSFQSGNSKYIREFKSYLSIKKNS